MRSDKPCPHYPDCVGCPLVGRPYGAQLEHKRQSVSAALRQYSSLRTVDVPAVIGSPKAFGCRNQAKLVVRRAGRGLLLGIYRAGTHQVVDIRRCPVHHPLIAQVIEAVGRVLEGQGVRAYDERTQQGSLRYVVVRVSTWSKRAQLILVTRERELEELRPLVRQLRRVRGLASIVQNVNPSAGNVIFGPSFLALHGDPELVERVGFLKLKSGPGTFLQVNIPIARRIYERVLQWAAPGADDTAVDLYCGVGALTFHLATAARHVVGIESSAPAVLDAKMNTRLNGFHNVRFRAGETGDVLPVVAESLGRIAVVTLNPPRKGADEATREAIAACGPERIVYVSCDPETLARDLDWFTHRGYAATDLQPYDMLPQTDHVECVALLRRRPS